MVLAQLVIKAICLLENIGCRVEGVVSDGASTNRKLWVELGISGQKDKVSNSFQNPLDPKRQIFMFADAPHLIKNVRNRLYNKKSLRVNTIIRFLIIYLNNTYIKLLGIPRKGIYKMVSLSRCLQ